MCKSHRHWSLCQVQIYGIFRVLYSLISELDLIRFFDFALLLTNQDSVTRKHASISKSYIQMDDFFFSFFLFFFSFYSIYDDHHFSPVAKKSRISKIFKVTKLCFRSDRLCLDEPKIARAHDDYEVSASDSRTDQPASQTSPFSIP